MGKIHAGGRLMSEVDWLALLEGRAMTASRVERPPSPGSVTFKRRSPWLGCGSITRAEPERARGDDGQPVQPRREPKFEPRAQGPAIRRQLA